VVPEAAAGSSVDDHSASNVRNQKDRTHGVPGRHVVRITAVSFGHAPYHVIV